jgi:UDP-N-acetylmuramyl pentapeptide phosphotransferase/UDP-N-acetylglucosamine-1-phosphate transferase
MECVPAIFCLLTAAAGWFYLFYSRAAHRLGKIEERRINQARVRLRRIGAAAMILLAVAFAVGYYGTNVREPTTAFVIAWLCVLLLLPVMLAIGLADLRLTRKLRRSQSGRPSGDRPKGRM